MSPIDFVLFDGDSDPDTPVSEVYDAMRSTLRLEGPEGEYGAVGYYCEDGRMVLEVEPLGNYSRKK